MLNWIDLISARQLEQIKTESVQGPVLIFKHSTRCSISTMALNRLQRSWDERLNGKVKPYFLDLLSHRDVSSEIAETFKVHHESPQVLLIDGGECTFDASHGSINYEELVEMVG